MCKFLLTYTCIFYPPKKFTILLAICKNVLTIHIYLCIYLNGMKENRNK